MNNISKSLLLPACGLIVMMWSCSRQHSFEKDMSPAPIIRSVSTDFGDKAVCGMPVEIHGVNFSSSVAENQIHLGVGLDVISVTPSEASEERLLFEAPLINGESIPMKVISKGKESSAYTLEYDLVRCDSVTLMRNAKVKTLREGVVWTNIYDEWEGNIRSINMVSIELSETNRLAFAHPEEYTRTSVQCIEKGALLGVNGSYFSHTFLRIDGEVCQTGRDQGVNTFMHDGVFTLDNNVPGIAYVGSNQRASQLTNQNVMCCGPLLISNNEHRAMVNHSHNTDTHPRTGVAITEDGKVLLVTVDGRFPERAVGLPTPLFARVLDAFGAEHALNLDGGGSTTMWIEGYGIVNHPCDERQWDDPVEREVDSIVYLK